MEKIEIHKVDSDLRQAKESADAVKNLQDEVENEIAQLKEANLRYNKGEISRQEHEDIVRARHDALSALNAKIKQNLDVLFLSLEHIKIIGVSQEPEKDSKSLVKHKVEKHRAKK
jgi:hypothetical protein